MGDRRLDGRYDWHDHRIHWMSKTPPERVREDGSARVEVFRWKLPLSAGGSAATISGSLTWFGDGGGGFPPAAAVLLAPACRCAASRPGGYRVKVTAYDRADNRSRTLVRRFRLR